jgi:LAGLIDADG-like domain
MNNQSIQQMVENGFATRRIAAILQLPEKDVKATIKANNWQLIKEDFAEDKIDHICELYQQGVSAKILGIKYSIDKRRIQKWMKERNMLRDKSAAHRFTEFNQHIFDVIDTPAKAYWLGFFYADAYNCKITNTVSMSLQISDLTHLQKLANFMELPINKIKYTKTKDEYEYYTLKMYSKYLCETLAAKGCPQAKSFIIQYPKWLSNDLNRHFIRGMFDGDGSLSKRQESNEWKWSLVSTQDGCENIQAILLNNIKIIVNFHCISETDNNTYEMEQQGNEKVKKIMEWLYIDVPNDILLERKYQKYLELIDQQNNRTFKKNEYKVSEENKINIVKDLSNGVKIRQVAKQYKIHPRTVTQIKHDDAFKFDKIVSVNNQPITAKYVKTLSMEERAALIEPLFQHFRQQGWLYPDNNARVIKSWKKLCDFQPDLSNNNLFNNSSLATDICKYFCHKFYDATEVGNTTMREIFANDDLLRALVQNRLGMDWKDPENDETFNISFRMMIQGMRSMRLVPAISIFKPDVAKYLCMKYSNENDVVYDYSAGWGGRMLGAASCNRQYIGVDPWTTDELQEIADFLELKNVQLIADGSENVKLNENSVDFSFSSPPYFNQEVYSPDKNQAYNNGENYFYDTYWAQTLDNIQFMLKPNKWFGLNVKNYPRMLQMAVDRFGEPVETVDLRTVKNHLNKKNSILKYEYIYMFRNAK